MDSQIDTIDKASIIEETNKIDMIAEWEWMDETIDDFMIEWRKNDCMNEKTDSLQRIYGYFHDWGTVVMNSSDASYSWQLSSWFRTPFTAVLRFESRSHWTPSKSPKQSNDANYPRLSPGRICHQFEIVGKKPRWPWKEYILSCG